MSYYGDVAAGTVLYLPFNSVDAGRALVVLAGSPAVAVYKDGGTGESTAGVTLTPSFDGRPGCNLVTINTAADGTFYATGHDFTVVLTSGTVDGVSAVGYVVGSFSIDHRSVGSGTAPTAAAIRAEMDTNSTKLASIDTKTLNLPSDPADASVLAASFTTINTKLDTLDNLVDTEIGTLLTNVALLLARLPALAVTTGTVAAAVENTATTFKTTLPSSENDFYKPALLLFTSGALTGQFRRIATYAGATTTVTMNDAFTARPGDGVSFTLVNR